MTPDEPVPERYCLPNCPTINYLEIVVIEPRYAQNYPPAPYSLSTCARQYVFMTTAARRAVWQTAALIALITCAAIPMFADGRTPQPAAAKQFKCYCQCEGHDGVASCPKKMCELPKYEARWWATSCHKRTAVPSVAKEPVSAQPSGRRTRSILNASDAPKNTTTQKNN
jgi:hypothetical protein